MRPVVDEDLCIGCGTLRGDSARTCSRSATTASRTSSPPTRRRARPAAARRPPTSAPWTPSARRLSGRGRGRPAIDAAEPRGRDVSTRPHADGARGGEGASKERRGRRSSRPRRPRPRRAHPGRDRRQPEPLGRQRRAAVDRQGVRLVADDARPDRRRLLARPRRLGALPGRARRPLRAQAHARARHGARHPRLAARRLRAVRQRPVPRPPVRRPRRRHGLPHHAGADHRAVGRAAADQVHRPVVRRRRRHGRARAAVRRPPPLAVLVGLRLPAHAPAGRARARAVAAARARPTSTRRPSAWTTSAACSPWSSSAPPSSPST